MPGRGRHQTPALERLIRDAEARGWSAVRRASGYFMLRCPCGLHQTMVHKTPSDPNYEKNKRKWLERTGCW